MLRERLLAKFDAFRDLCHLRRTLWDLVFEFDHARELPLLFLHQLQRFHHRRLALPKRHIFAVVQLAILHVDMRHPVMKGSTEFANSSSAAHAAETTNHYEFLDSRGQPAQVGARWTARAQRRPPNGLRTPGAATASSRT